MHHLDSDINEEDMYSDSFNTDVDLGNPQPANNNSFRDSGRTFLVPPASNSSSFYGQQPQSFLAFYNPPNLGIAARDDGPDLAPPTHYLQLVLSP